MLAAAGEGRARREGTGAAGEGRLPPGVLAPPAETEKEQGAKGREVEAAKGAETVGGNRLKEEREETRGDSECNFVCLFVCLFPYSGLRGCWRGDETKP